MLLQFGLFNTESNDQSAFQNPPFSLHSKLNRAYVKPLPASAVNMINPSAREAYFLEDMRLSENTDPNVFYIKSPHSEKEVVDLTGSQSSIPAFHSDVRPKDQYQLNDVPTLHEEKWETAGDAWTDIVGAWNGDAVLKKRIQATGVVDETKKNMANKIFVRHDENWLCICRKYGEKNSKKVQFE